MKVAFSKDDFANAVETGDPANAFREAQRRQLALCDTLEAIADSLPDQIDREKCAETAESLGPLIRKVHRLEEDTLFPLIELKMDADLSARKSLQRLKFEHCEDECFAEELTEALRGLATGRAGMNMEATGYMLRGFFEAMRRHIAFEQEIVLPWLD